ncbi:MAG: hypothetical protein KF819_02630 [Labilithrix sp.]|nr:hypothetical protein [Labilithrix sp.]
MRVTKVAIVHALVLAAPVAASGRTAELARPRALACIAIMIAFSAIESSARKAPDPSRFGAPGTGLALASSLALLATTWAAIALPVASPSPWTWVGAPLALAGIALRRSAILALGDAFISETVLVPGRPIVMRGIYRLRHPSEVGLSLVAAGVASTGGSLVAACLAAAVVGPTILARVAREERLLARL